MATYRERALKGGASGSESGKVARFGALEKLIERRMQVREMMKGSSGGKIRPRYAPPTDEELKKWT